MPEISALPDHTLEPTVFGYAPENTYDRDRGAKALGFANEADLLAGGNEANRKSLDAAEASWQNSNDQISSWLEDHVKTSIAVHDLITAVANLEQRASEQSARIRALEARIGIESIDK
jgi:hypothetical protein